MVTKGNEVAIPSSSLARIDSNAIEEIKQNTALCQKLAETLLEDGIDYGISPGTQNRALWDAGSVKIIRGFQCHVEHTILPFTELNDEHLTWVVEAKIIHNDSKMLVGTGMGCCSTRETKYAYRWVTNPAVYGYSPEQIQNLRSRVSQKYEGKTEYRIDNPDVGDLIHTLLSQASKRAEVDAAKSLPGVVSVLKKLFEKDDNPGYQQKKAPGNPKEDDLSFKDFYAFFNKCGINNTSIHAALGVASMKDWISSGKTLQEARELITKKLVDLSRRPEKSPAEVKKEQQTEEQMQELWERINEDHVHDVQSLIKVCNDCWGLVEDEIWRMTGYSDRKTFVNLGAETPWDIFNTIKSKMTTK